LNSRRSSADHKLGHLCPNIVAALCVLAVCSALLLIKPWQPIVRFDSEMIHVTVDPERITVDGIYRIYNPLPFPVSQWFYYPTPLGGGLKPVDLLRVEELTVKPEDGQKVLEPRVKGGEKYYWVTVPGRETLEVRALYSQRHNGSYGRYILTTTAGWGRPLRHAQFELKLESLDLVDSNYELTGNENKTWSFKRTGFMPNEDWFFTFKGTGGVT